MKKWKGYPGRRLAFNALIFFACFTLVERLCHLATDGFSVMRIYPPFQIDSFFDPPAPSQEVCKHLNQSYRYLGSGSQSFAFLSEDGQYVLKFFKLKTGYWRVPSLSRPKRRRESFTAAFQSCLIHADTFKDESGVVYCHLKASNHNLPTVTLIDRNRRLLSLDLSTLPFVLQKYAEPVDQRLLRFKKANDRKSAEQTIDQLFNVLLKRYHLGLSDRDPNLITNFGFIDNQAVSIDVGGLVNNRQDLKTYFCEHEILKAKHKCNRWLYKHNPDLVDHVEKIVEDIISSER
ncbi:MAG: hypothetical protein H7A40_03155 [Chlamydiales bacterium]|nr:hypothetical protein [Chlamydiales bacterium]